MLEREDISMISLKRKVSILIMIAAIVVGVVGCDKNNTLKKSGNGEIAEAEVVVEDDEKDTNVQTQEVIPTIEPGGKVTLTDAIKNDVLALAPGLNDYRAGSKITEEIKFKFVYYGYIYSDLTNYPKQELRLNGKNTTWVAIPKAEVDAKFKNTFGIDLGEYAPTVNEGDPMIYYENNNYYICTSVEADKLNYSLLESKGSVVKVKEVYEEDEQYNEISITLQTATNEKGYIVTEVVSLPR